LDTPLSVKKINILGATGSIGKSVSDVILSAPAQFEVGLVTAHQNAADLADVAKKLGARKAVIANQAQYQALKDHLSGTKIEVAAGAEALEDAARQKADLTIASIMGMAGLKPLMAAIEGSAAVAVANKEPLVAAGPLVLAHAAKNKAQILPLDSEHNAIFQVFDQSQKAAIERIILTASGGPFRTWSLAEMAKATPAQALAHPNWSMGRKISIDSANMMNKALEIIEAHYLFDMPADKIDVLVHPQSVIHSLVEYADGSLLAQLGANDMRTPISHVLAWPQRMKTPGQRLDFKHIQALNFEPPDHERFPALNLAYSCLKAGQAACITMNAANEIAVEAFLTNHIGFLDIIGYVQDMLDKTNLSTINTLDEIILLDQSVRSETHNRIYKTNAQKTQI
jgi:1-deoxy-D-xylulose-5-phosphate reductoisomerase